MGDTGKENKRSDLPKDDGKDQRTPPVSFVSNETGNPNAQPTKAESPHWYTIPEWWLVILGVPTLIYLIRQEGILQGALEEIHAQADIARKTLVVQFRPKVRVRSMKLNPSTTAQLEMQSNGSWAVEINLINAGGTVAIIQECEATFFMQGEHPRVVTGQFCSEKWEPFSMQSGERKTLKLDIPVKEFGVPFRTLWIAVVERGFQQLNWPTCMGTIKYADENGTIRQTGFRWAWDAKGERFVASSDPEEEYAD